MRAFIHDFAGWVALMLPGKPIRAWKLDEGSTAIIALCTGYGSVKSRDPVTGNWVVEAGGSRRRETR